MQDRTPEEQVALAKGSIPRLVAIMKWTSAASAAGFLMVVFIAITVQITARAFGILVPSADDVARFAMAISALHGLAYTYWEGAHVRVTLVIGKLRGRLARSFAIVIVLVATAAIGLLTYSWAEMTLESLVYDSRSAGLLALPNWLIQLIALLGLVLFFASVLVDAITTLLRGESLVESGG